MSDYKATETCSCGASITVETAYASAFRDQLEAWRSGHHHEPKPAPAPEEQPHSDKGSITSMAASSRSDSRPPVFGFAPRWPL